MICPPGKTMIFYKKETKKIELVARPVVQSQVHHGRTPIGVQGVEHVFGEILPLEKELWMDKGCKLKHQVANCLTTRQNFGAQVNQFFSVFVHEKFFHHTNLPNLFDHMGYTWLYMGYMGHMEIFLTG